jgi:hypothetical protein
LVADNEEIRFTPARRDAHLRLRIGNADFCAQVDHINMVKLSLDP